MWADHNPDFKIHFWGEAELLDLKLENKDVICNTDLNPALRADFLRLELLYQFGGIYADIDMTCEKSIEPLLTKCSFIAGIAFT